MMFFKKQSLLAGPPASSVYLGSIKDAFLSKREYLTQSELNHHVHIVGASGFGKTVLIEKILKNKIESGEGLLFIDLKGDIDMINKLNQLAIKADRAHDLQVFSLSNQKLSLNYNLVAEGTATQLRDRILASLNWSEEYYKNQSSSFLLKLLIGLCYIRDKSNFKFGLKEILKAASDKSYLEEQILKLKEKDELKPKIMLEECYLFLKESGNYNSLQGLRTQLESIVLSDFGEFVSGGPGISLFDSVQSKKITFMYLDSRRYGESARAVGRFILQDLKAMSARIDSEIPAAARSAFTVVIDEFSDLAEEDFISFLDRARSSRMALVIAHQELSDLQRISPEFMARLTGNTSTLYAFLQKNPKSAEMISGMAGTTSSWKQTMQTDRFFFLEFDSGKGTRREVEEFNIHPNVVKSLRVGECICIKKYPESKSYIVKVKMDSPNYARQPLRQQVVKRLAAFVR